MHVEGLTRENVASHLQKYRLQLKKENKLDDEGNLIGGAGRDSGAAHDSGEPASSNSLEAPQVRFCPSFMYIDLRVKLPPTAPEGLYKRSCQAQKWRAGPLPTAWKHLRCNFVLCPYRWTPRQCLRGVVHCPIYTGQR